jgi:hypothetical protein
VRNNINIMVLTVILLSLPAAKDRNVMSVVGERSMHRRLTVVRKTREIIMVVFVGVVSFMEMNESMQMRLCVPFLLLE